MTNPTDEEYYRIAANAAKNFFASDDSFYVPGMGMVRFKSLEVNSPNTRNATAALAFQLRDQVNAIDGGEESYAVEITKDSVIIVALNINQEFENIVLRVKGSTALEWIKCVVDSGLLGGGE